MTRQGRDEYLKGRLMNGYDYQAQAWVVNGVYQPCGRPAAMRQRGACCNAFTIAGHPTRSKEHVGQ